MSFLRRVFRLKTILVVCTLIGATSLVLSYLSSFIHPETSSVLPFFGLTYYYIFIVNVIILLVWAVMKSRWSLFVLLIIIIGGKLHFRYFAFGSDDKNEGITELKITSYNVRLFDVYNSNLEEGDSNRKKMFEYISAQNSDIYCFQEFFNRGKHSSYSIRDSLINLTQAVDIHEHYVEQISSLKTFGIAMYSKYPIIEKGFVSFLPLENSPPSFNYCIYADIVKDADTFRVYNVHLQSISLKKTDYTLFEEGVESNEENSNGYFKLANKIRKAYPVRAEQARLLAEHMNTSEYPVVICGDFNDTPLSYTYNIFGSQMTDAFRNTSFGTGVTYAGKMPAGRIDYIFHSTDIGSKNFYIQEEAYSDHFAINCTVFKK
ncbi:MAG: endonuclease/exonuclease/phosphatase family protein [Crocinitomicaceae bacterium]|nr:endonuclease/exonuclease/phosphatase family protein [Crocinitomicaceae bacterium]